MNNLPLLDLNKKQRSRIWFAKFFYCAVLNNYFILHCASAKVLLYKNKEFRVYLYYTVSQPVTAVHVTYSLH